MPRSSRDSLNTLTDWFQDNLSVDQKEDLIFLLNDPSISDDLFGPFAISASDDPSDGNSEAGTDYSTSDGSGGGGGSTPATGAFLFTLGAHDVGTGYTTTGIVPQQVLSGSFYEFVLGYDTTLTGSLGVAWHNRSGGTTLDIQIRKNGITVQTVSTTMSGTSGSAVVPITDESFTAGDEFDIRVKTSSGTIDVVSVTALGTA